MLLFTAEDIARQRATLTLCRRVRRRAGSQDARDLRKLERHGQKDLKTIDRYRRATASTG